MDERYIPTFDYLLNKRKKLEEVEARLLDHVKKKHKGIPTNACHLCTMDIDEIRCKKIEIEYIEKKFPV